MSRCWTELSDFTCCGISYNSPYFYSHCTTEEVSPTHSGDGGRVLSLNRHRTAFLLDLYRGRDAGFPQGARAAILNARAMIEVSIPSMHREVDEAGKTRKVSSGCALTRAKVSFKSLIKDNPAEKNPSRIPQRICNGFNGNCTDFNGN